MVAAFFFLFFFFSCSNKLWNSRRIRFSIYYLKTWTWRKFNGNSNSDFTCTSYFFWKVVSKEQYSRWKPLNLLWAIYIKNNQQLVCDLLHFSFKDSNALSLICTCNNLLLWASLSTAWEWISCRLQKRPRVLKKMMLSWGGGHGLLKKTLSLFITLLVMEKADGICLLNVQV